MSTQPQILANRLNAQKSTGPKTPKGKAAASKNALKHGLSASHDVIITESQEDYDRHRDSLLAELAPQTPMESILADRIVSLAWRLERAATIQNQTIDAMDEESKHPPFPALARLRTRNREHQDPALTLGRLALKDFSNEKVLDRLLMYERRLENSLYKTTRELQKLKLLRNLYPQTQTGPLTHRQPTTQALFMQNEPNPKNPKTNLTLLNAMSYTDTQPRPIPKNEPNSNTIQPNPPAQIEKINPIQTHLNPIPASPKLPTSPNGPRTRLRPSANKSRTRQPSRTHVIAAKPNFAFCLSSSSGIIEPSRRQFNNKLYGIAEALQLNKRCKEASHG